MMAVLLPIGKNSQNLDQLGKLGNPETPKSGSSFINDSLGTVWFAPEKEGIKAFSG